MQMGPTKDSEGKLLCEQKDFAEHLKQTFFEAVHLKIFSSKKENYLQTGVRIPLLEETLDIWQDEFITN